jgi:PPM family protein phosphatase
MAVDTMHDSQGTEGGIVWSACTATGRVRSINEDSFIACGRVFAVVDGGGVDGRRAGRIASGWSGTDGRDLIGHLSAGLRVHPGDGAAVIAVTVEETRMRLAWIGDCVGFHLRRDKVMRLTRPHRLVERYVDSGSCSAEQARSHADRNILYRFVGQDSEPPAELELAVASGEAILLCSDGVWSCLDAMPRLPDARAYVQAALEAGSTDNATAVVLSMR